MLSNLKIWTYLSRDKLEEQNDLVNDSIETENKSVPDSTEPNASNMSDKATEWGSYILEAGKAATNLAAKHVTTTAKSLRQNVSDMNIIERGNILTSFSNEQIKFKNEKRQLEKKTDEVCLPWIDALNCNENDEQNLKGKILSVSLDERNFIRNPPAGSDFEFNYVLYSPVAVMLLKEDPKLSEMRFKLVPKKINEETFWRNYFYRISLIKQSLQVNSESKETENEKSASEVQEQIVSQKPVNEESIDNTNNQVTHNNEAEINQLKNAMIQSGSFNNPKGTESAEDWEAELQKELSEFELIAEDSIKDPNEMGEKVDFDDIEKEIMDELKK